MIDVTGQKFGSLTAIRQLRKGGRHRGIVWLWRCDCGNEIERVSADIIRGHQKSCGCLKSETLRNKRIKPIGTSAFYLLYTSYRFKAIQRGYSFELSQDEFRSLTEKDCFYCGQHPAQTMIRKGMNGGYIYNGIDRIDNTKGYTTKNCVPCCGTCNIMKRDKSVDEFLIAIERIYKYRGKH